MNFSELLVILVVALVVFGPERLPTMARRLGLWASKFHQLKSKWDQELEQQLHQFKLQENEEKAKAADKKYLSELKAPDPQDPPTQTP